MNPYLEIVVKAVVWSGLVAVVGWLAKRLSAAARHRIYVLGFLGLAVIPLLQIQLPVWQVEAPLPRASWQPGVADPKPLPEYKPLSSKLNTQVLPAPRVPEPEPSRVLEGTLLCLWGLFGILLLANLFGQIEKARLWARWGRELTMTGLPPHTRLLESPDVQVPMTLGHLRPTILVPDGFADLPTATQNAVLQHESAHIRRCDWAWLLFARVICSVYWFLPLSLLLERPLRVAAENAADDAVLSEGIDAAEYASVLVSMAEMVKGRQRTAVALPLIEAESLKARVAAILAAGRQRIPLTRKAVTTSFVIAFCVGAPLAAMHFKPQPLVAHGGVLPIGHGQMIEVLAVTKMDGDRATSWNMAGQRLARPYYIDRQALEWFAKSYDQPGGMRYVILALPSYSGSYGFSLPVNGKHLFEWPGMNLTLDGLSFPETRADGREVVIVGIPIRVGQRAVSLRTSVPGGDWQLEGEALFQDGRLMSSSPGRCSINLTPALKAEGGGTKIEVDLRRHVVDREVMVQFSPGSSGTSLIGEDGKVDFRVSIPAEKLTRVSVFLRRIEPAMIQDIPMELRSPEIAPAGEVSLRAGALEASGDAVQVDEATRLTYLGVAPPEKEEYLAKARRLLPQLGLKEIELCFQDKTIGPCLNGISFLADGEGRSMGFIGNATIHYADHDVHKNTVLVPSGTTKSDVLLCYSYGAHKTVREFHDLSEEQSKEKGSRPQTLVKVPSTNDLVKPDEDYRWQFFDRRNHEVQASGYSSDGNGVSIYWPKEAKAEVGWMRLQTRPKRWIRFRDLDLTKVAVGPYVRFPMR